MRYRRKKVASKASPLISNAFPARPQLLISVQNASEAWLADSLGVPWIDLKNPALGSLGCPDVTTAREVLGALAVRAGTPRCQTSVALGELPSLDTATALELMQLFPIAKVGLAGLTTETCTADPTEPNASELIACGPDAIPRVDLKASLDDELLQRLELLWRQQRSAGQLVLAAYADHQRAAAPSPAQVIELARQFQARYVLIDTFLKDGLGLFHWQSTEQIAALRQSAESIGAQLVVAGSLSTADWPLLSQAAPAIVGVRGGVCTHGRASQLCPDRIAQWLNWAHG